ncbi:MAG: hypothetical protein U0X91_22755 [Spirosomataceae bacterium]
MKKIIRLSLGLVFAGMINALAQNFSCTVGSPVRVQFTGCGSTPTWTDNNTSAVALRTISTAGTYTVNCGGTLYSFRITNINACPSFACDLSLSASVNPVTAGQSSVLSYSGCAGGTVSWDNGLGTGNNKTVTPSATTTYNATCTPANGSICTKSVTVNFVDCSVTATANPTTVTPGQSSVLSYSGCAGGTVDWVTDNDIGVGSGNNVTVNPATTTNYIAVCHKGGGFCLGPVTVNVNNCSVTASATSTSINAGQSTTLAYFGCSGGNVSWNNGAGSGNNRIVSPAATTTYTATCTPAGGGSTCTSSVTINVTACSVLALAQNPTINAGQSTVLAYENCTNGTVSWDNGLGTGNNKTVTPAATTTYTATCTPTGGGSTCSSSVIVNVITCSITASASPTTINAGQSTTLSYTGCSNGTVSWNNGAGNGNNRIVTPGITTTYTATCTPTGGGTPCTSSVTVNVGSCSVTASATLTNINAGQSTTLAYFDCAGGNVSWNNGAGSGNNRIVTPATTTTYTATCTPAGGGSTCTSSVTINVTACSVLALAQNPTINAGQSTVLAYENCTNGTVSWDNGLGSGNNKTVMPASTTTYTATCTPAGGGTTCSSSVTVTVNSCNITASASPTNINAGQSTTLSYTGCTGGSVSWDNGAGSGNNRIVTPAGTTTYTATCMPAGGGSTCTASVTVNSCSVTASATLTSINAGQSTTLAYFGCAGGNVSWNNGAGNGNNRIVTPAATTTYTATCIPAGGGSTCTSSVTINVTACSVLALAQNPTINAGQSTVLAYENCTNGTVSWDNGLGTGNNKTVTPAATTTYTATCTPTGGGSTCTSSVTVNVITCSITASASPTNINAGQSTTLSYTGCSNGTVSWNNGAGNGNNVLVSPVNTTTYTATCTPNGGGISCSSAVTVTVNCTLTASASPNNINAGQSSTLSYTGCIGGSVNWDNGLGTGNNKTVTPAATTTYTATCTPNGGGSPCTSSVTVNVTSCTVTATASPNNINAGQTSTLSYSGCIEGTANWDNSLGSGNNKAVTPSSTITYTVTCTPNGGGAVCTASVTVTVSSCTVSASASPNNINAGQISVLSYSGCSNGSVSWDNGLGTGNNKTVTPAATTTYTATCTPNGGGTSCTSSVTVNVTNCTLSASASPNNINAGQSSTLTYSGCAGGSVSWDNGAGNGNNRVISPATATTYTATCSPNGGGAVCTASVTVNVTSCNLIASVSSNNINAGQSTILSYSGCNGGNVSWSNGAGNGNNIVVTPSATTTYTATCTPNGGGSVCTSSVTVNVTSCTLTAVASATTVNAGQTVTLSYSGCNNGTVSWSNGTGSGNNVSVNPSFTATYTATCTPNAGGSGCTASVTINVIACNLSVAAASSNLNAGQITTLSYSGCTNGSVSWDNDAGSGNNRTVIPAFTTTYTATCVPNGGGNTCTASITINVIPCSVSAFASPPGINVGQSTVLNYTGCANGTVSWNNGVGNGNNRTVTPVFTTTYTATCTPNGGGNACNAEVTVTVNPAPISIVSSTGKAPSCTDGKNGSITLGLSRRIVTGETDIRLTLLKNNTVAGTYLTQSALFVTPENLEAGTYQAVIETLIGSVVSARAEGSVTLVDPPPVVFSLSKTDIKCFGGSDGTMQIEAGGGTGTFFYQLNAGSSAAFNGGAKHNFTNVGLGTYSLRVSDSFNCTAPTQTITVNQPAAPVELTKISQKDPRGFETKDGQGVVSVKGGTPNYVFEWVDEKGVSYGAGVTTLPDNANKTLHGGTYFARVYDANYAAATQKAGCFSEVTFALVEPPIIEARIDVAKEISCFGKKDGTLLVIPKGGVPSASGYTLQLYSKTNATLVYLPNKTSFEKLPAGAYTLMVTDANDVSRSFNYTLTEPSKVTAKVISTTQPACFGDKTGSIEINAGGGRGTYTAAWSNSAKVMKLTNLAGGKYTAVVTDLTGCQSDIVSAEIKEPPKLEIAFNITQPTCSYSCNGSVRAVVTGGTGAYQMSWEGRNDRDARIENLCGNELLLFRVSDANQCSATKSALLTRPAALISKVEPEKKLCQGQSILLDATHEQADSYLWKLPDGTTSTQPAIETKQVGSYSLSLFDKAKCEFKSAVNVTQVAAAGKIRFASASTAPRNESVVVLNLSDPAPAKTDWLLPKEAVVSSKTNERVEFSIGTLGNYTVGIKANFAACEMYQAKSLAIVEFYPKAILVTNDNVILKVSPNPSFDDVEVTLRFLQPTSFRLRLFEAAAPDRVAYETEEKDLTDFVTKISALSLKSGQYILTVDTPTGRISQKVTVLK